MNEGGHPTAFWPVGPSFLFSLCYRVFGWENERRFLAVAVLNVMMGTASVVLTMVLGSKWFGERVAVGAGLLLALWPSQIEFVTVLNSEVPMIFFMLVGLATWEARCGSDMSRGLIAGACLAAASYMRPTALMSPLIFLLPRLINGPRRLRAVGGMIVMIATMAAMILPWSLRNQRIFGTLVPISTNGGVNFWMGNNPQTTGFYQDPPTSSMFSNEYQRDRQLKKAAWNYVRQEPWSFVTRTVVKAIRLHERESIGVVWNSEGLARRFPHSVAWGLKLASNVFWWVALALAVVGVFRLGRRGLLRHCLTAPPVLIWVYFAAVHSLTVIQDRYHFAYIPLLAILSVIALSPRDRPPKTGALLSPHANYRVRNAPPIDPLPVAEIPVRFRRPAVRARGT